MKWFLGAALLLLAALMLGSGLLAYAMYVLLGLLVLSRLLARNWLLHVTAGRVCAREHRSAVAFPTHRARLAAHRSGPAARFAAPRTRRSARALGARTCAELCIHASVRASALAVDQPLSVPQ